MRGVDVAVRYLTETMKQAAIILLILVVLLIVLG